MARLHPPVILVKSVLFPTVPQTSLVKAPAPLVLLVIIRTRWNLTELGTVVAVNPPKEPRAPLDMPQQGLNILFIVIELKWVAILVGRDPAAQNKLAQGVLELAEWTKAAQLEGPVASRLAHLLTLPRRVVSLLVSVAIRILTNPTP